MATLDDIRAKVPSLRGLTDEQALQYLQQRYTPDVPVATIARNLGMSVPEPAAPPAPKRSLFAVANDTVIEAANAAAGTAGSIANFVSPGNRFSQGVDDFIRQGEASQSDAVNQDRNRFRERMKNAQGVGDELAAVGGYIADSPLQALAQAAGSIAVPGAAMKVAGALGGGVKTGLGIGAGIGGAGAGGDAAGTAYELAKEAGATDEEATAAARSASVIPGIVGAAGGVIGAERLLAGAKGFGGGAVSRALKTAGVEGVQEGIEEGITQYEGQRAAVPFDPTIDPMKGVAGAAAMGVALGGATGGGVSLLTGAPAPGPDPKAEADAAMDALGSASTVDEAVALATKATDIPVLPTRNPNSAKMVKARNAGTLAWVRDLDREDQTAALGLMAVMGNPRTPETVRRAVSAQLDALERKARTIPTGEASEVLPTGDVFDDQDIPVGEATELRTGMAIDGRNYYDPDMTWEQRRERLRRAAGLPPAMESTELLPTGEVTEADPIPAGEAFEQIPVGEAAEVLPTGEATDLIPTGDASEMQRSLIPTGRATEIEPDQADQDLLLTVDGMPYGTRSAAYVRAKKEGGEVVEVPGGWAVKKESQGEPVQPDVAAATRSPAGPSDGRGDNPRGSGVPVGSVPAAPGGVVQPAAGAGAGNRANQPVATAGGADPALSVADLSRQWADAVARGDGKEAQRLNVAITKLNEAARRAAAGQDRNGLTAQDRAAGALGSAASELSSQIQGDIAENDFDPDEVMPGLRMFAEQAKVPADDLRQEVLKRLRASGMKRGDLKRVERAMDPATPPVQGTPPAPQPEPEAALAAQPVAEAPKRDVMPEGLTVTFGGRTFKVDSLEDAQAKWIEFRDRAGAGVREVGNGVVVEDGAGRMVGRISYNGRIFDPADNMVAEAPEPEAAPAAEVAAKPDEVVTVTTQAPPTKPPEPPQQTRPERLIELRKRQSVLKQLLECLG
jgi:hypothetical protein